MALGKKFKQLLDDRGMTVKEFAKLIDVPPTTLYSFINRDSNDVKMDLLMKICNTLGVDIFDILEMQPSPLTDKEEKELELNGTFSRGVEDSKGPRADMFNGVGTMAAHFDGDEYTEEELKKIKEFASFVKSQRKSD